MLIGARPLARGSALPWIALAGAGGGVGCGVVSFVWAAIFSVGFKGASTDDTIRHNLSDPLPCVVAYGPLAVSLLLIVISGVLAVVAAARALSRTAPQR